MKKHLLGIISIAIFSTLSATSSFAAVGKEFKKIESNLKKNNPGIPKIESINKTPIKNIYEVVINKNEIFYAEESGKYILLGNLLKSENGTHTNLTEEKLALLSKINFKSLNLKNAIIKVNGTGEKTIATFEDPNCGFCRKLQPELEKLENTTIYTFIIPILGKQSAEIVEKVWCSKDKWASWNNYMTQKIVPEITAEELAKCDKSALNENIAFAQKNGITGTPTIYFKDGTSVKGYIGSEEIKARLK